jgi:vacuolar-type H+-ATPase subunit H
MQMELIKKIKHTEAQAQEIIEQAKAHAAQQAERGRTSRLKASEEADRQRKKTVEDAVAAAQTQGLAEVEKLKTQAEKERQQLREKTAGRIAPAAAKVMDYLRG